MLYEALIATARSHLAVKKKEVKTLTMMQISLHTIDLAMDLLLVSCMVSEFNLFVY